MPAVSNNPSNSDGNENKKSSHGNRETGAQRKEREEEAERRKKAKEDRELSDVTYKVLDIIKEIKLPTAGRIRVSPINGTKFRANYYVDHVIVWTKCVAIKADGRVTVCSIQ